MKKKIITFILTFTVFLFNCIPSHAFAPAIPISYELLMGLMAVGTAFGLSLPKDDVEYWDYTRSLRNHLSVVDDEYLRLLDKSAKEWRQNSNNNDDEPDNDTPFIVPVSATLVSVLSELFDKVGKDVSISYTYVNTLLNPLMNFKDYTSYTNSDISFNTLTQSNQDLLTYKIYPNCHNHEIKIASGGAKGAVSYVYDKSFANYEDYYNKGLTIMGSQNSTGVAKVTLFTINGDLALGYLNSSNAKQATYLTCPTTGQRLTFNKYVKPVIPYSPITPNIDNDELIVPNGVPNINIPGIDTIPGVSPGDDVNPPFDVSEPLPVPGTNPNPGDDVNPGDDINPGEGTIWEQVLDFVTNLLVPSDSFWTNTFNEFATNFGNSFPIIDMSKFNDLIVDGKPFPNIDVNIMGVNARVVNGDVINSIVDWLRPIIAGFMMLCLMFFNYRKIYKLIRNTEPFGNIAPGTSDFRTGISEYNAQDNAYEIAQAKIRDTMFDIRNEFLSNKNKEGK